MNVGHIVETLEQLAPLRYAEAWDKVGLAVGSRAWRARRILLTIDLTEPVLDEAIEAEAEMIVAYHPLIFEPLAALTDTDVKERIALRAARADIAVYCPHTALDAAPGGVNDWLAESLGSGDVRALEAHGTVPATQECKIVTFCPATAVDAIRDGLASVGAGRIGLYERCSFEIEGTGTFVATGAARPAVGRKGLLERLDEVRLEMICPGASLPLAVLALRQFHPYEEPPIEIYQLHGRPDRHIGAGRRVVLDRKVPLKTLLDAIKRRLGVDQLRVAPRPGAARRYEAIGLCAGAGGALADSAIDQGCELYLTGEMRHHDVLAAQARDCTVVLAGHTNTERGYLKILRHRLAAELGDVEIRIARADADPLRRM